MFTLVLLLKLNFSEISGIITPYVLKHYKYKSLKNLVIYKAYINSANFPPEILQGKSFLFAIEVLPMLSL